MRKRIDLTGRRYNMLTFVRPTEDADYWIAQCDCGNVTRVRHSNVRHAGQKSCGCAKSFAKRKHGMAHHPAYKRWNSMISRCERPDDQNYKHYGAKGIKVCERWHNFELFWADMGSGWRAGVHLYRINTDGDYTPSNVIWATSNEMARARLARKCGVVPDGREKVNLSIKELSQKYGIGANTLRSRVRRGWKMDKLQKPVDILKSSSART